ncbi:MAG: hypothetical protein OJJ55_11775 [Rhodococcus sp.]|nr:hypothetical protein [Rhodococcus sp. (in: high G+C Gram-positive bacteria)]
MAKRKASVAAALAGGWAATSATSRERSPATIRCNQLHGSNPVA